MFLVMFLLSVDIFDLVCLPVDDSGDD